MRLKKPESGEDELSLTLSVMELTEAQALARFAKAGIAYDAEAAYVSQIFVYVFLQPGDLIKDPDTQAAFAAIESLSTTESEVVLRLPKAQMRQLLTMLSMAAESEDKADIIRDSSSDPFPDLEFPGDYYAEIFEQMLAALYSDRSLSIDRLPSH